MTPNALFPRAQRRHRVYRGLTVRQERVFTWVAATVILLMMAGWIGAIIEVRQQQKELARDQKAVGGPIAQAPAAAGAPMKSITSALTNPAGPTAAFMNEALLTALGPLRGQSGKLLFATRQPGAAIVRAPGAAPAAPQDPGMYKLASQIAQASRAFANFNLFTVVPLAEKQQGKIGLYYLGNWPFESGGGRPKTAAYATPSGFIEVTPQNQNTYVSEHFQLHDFVTHDQGNVWPKYVPLNPNLVDKLELTIQELEKQGIKVTHMTVMSGFRTPSYNKGGGNTEGRANLSRHMYGDASDVFVDNDRNGVMDDLNHDGRVDVRDADVIRVACERVEQKYPSLVGGIGVYSACCGHGPFTHIDVRGYRARWRGFGNG